LPATDVAAGAVRSYRTFSPLPSAFAAFAAPARVGCVFSVPLSVRLPCPGVTRRTALRSSDFPPAFALRASARQALKALPRRPGYESRRLSGWLRRNNCTVWATRHAWLMSLVLCSWSWVKLELCRSRELDIGPRTDQGL